MTQALQWRTLNRALRQARAVSRLCAVLWLVCHIAWTPIHLYLAPHLEDADHGVGIPLASAAGVAVPDDHDEDAHHARHPAAQHKFKVIQPVRAMAADFAPTQVAQWAEAEEDCPQPEVVAFSGLSPPEFSRCWQFIFRAALPVRAPSLLS